MSGSVAWESVLTAVLAGAMLGGTPIAFAAIGETMTERSGVINLGIEGMMLIGALVGVVVQVETGNAFLAVFAAGLAAAFLAGLHAVMTIGLNSNQLVSGIVLSIVGTGLSGFLGRPYVGRRFEGIGEWHIPYLKDLPFLGKIVFQHDVLVYLAILSAWAMWYVLYKTRFGLEVRAVGEEPYAAYARGVSVRRSRVFAVVVGGFLAGIGGAHLSLAYTQIWAERMTAGQGWIAVGLVAVAGWHPVRALLAAFLFGALSVLHPTLQASGVAVSPYLLKMLPYLCAVVALTMATCMYTRKGQGLPAALAQEFQV